MNATWGKDLAQDRAARKLVLKPLLNSMNHLCLKCKKNTHVTGDG